MPGLKPTCAIHWQRRGWRRWWRWTGHAPTSSRMIWIDSRPVSCRRGPRQTLNSGRRGCQNGNVAVSLFVDLDGSLLLQLVDLLLQVTLSLDGLILLLQHLSQGLNLGAGVFVSFLWGKTRNKNRTGQITRKYDSALINQVLTDHDKCTMFCLITDAEA